ncbi:MAG: helicase-related protein, partial [Casimicrobiaceae bacterium]
DRMLDMGFIPDIKRIMALLPATAKRQNLLWSATFSNEIKRLADQLLNEPQLIEVARRNEAAETVTQRAYKCPQDAKRALLAHIVKSRNLSQVLCFVRTKHGASRLARQLEKDGLVTEAIHGDKTQQARLEALSAFKEGKLQVLVATDVAARGLDIDDLPLVVNYELPHTPEDYVHRIGRTGRAGASGEAISFVAPEEEKYLVEIERMLKTKVSVESADGFDANAAAARTPMRERADRSERRPGGRASSPRAHSTGSTVDRTTASATANEADPSVGASAVPSNGARVRDRGEGHRDDGRSARERQREEVYANNPDQPLVSRPADDTGNAQSAKSALMHGSNANRHGAGKHKPIPALLMKRRTPEPENA